MLKLPVDPTQIMAQEGGGDAAAAAAATGRSRRAFSVGRAAVAALALAVAVAVVVVVGPALPAGEQAPVAPPTRGGAAARDVRM